MSEQNKKIDKSKRFWKYFWSTIIVFAVFYTILVVTASNKSIQTNEIDKKARLESILKEFKSKYPKFTQMIDNLNEESINKIKEVIDKEIDEAYEPVYDRIDVLSDFHYSVTGEYSELFTIIFGKVEKILNEKMFAPIDFDERLNDAFENINNESLEIVKNQLNEMKSEVKNKMNLSDDDVNFLFSNILKLTQENLKQRFLDYKYNLFKGMGLGVGAGAGVLIAKIVSKNMAKVIAKKIATKAAIKGGVKIAGAAAGATAGGESGLLCGPGAWLCSPVGAVVGGVVGWFASDKVVVEIDKYFNSEEFKESIKTLIDKQKESTKLTLYKVYMKSFNELSNANKKSLADLKSKPIKDIMK